MLPEISLLRSFRCRAVMMRGRRDACTRGTIPMHPHSALKMALVVAAALFAPVAAASVPSIAELTSKWCVPTPLPQRTSGGEGCRGSWG